MSDETAHPDAPAPEQESVDHVRIRFAGDSGDGMQLAGARFTDASAIFGNDLATLPSYPAEIRGFGRCVTHSRVGDQEMLALSDRTHVLISLDDKESQSRTPFLAREAVVLFDSKPPSYGEEGSSIAAHVEPDARLFGMPFSDLAASASGSTRGRNLAALGGFAAIFGVPEKHFQEVITKKFKGKGEKVLGANLQSFDAGYHYASDSFKEREKPVLALPEPEKEKRILISGNEAVARGALDAGLKLYFGYPITPATPIMDQGPVHSM